MPASGADKRQKALSNMTTWTARLRGFLAIIVNFNKMNF